MGTTFYTLFTHYTLHTLIHFIHLIHIIRHAHKGKWQVQRPKSEKGKLGAQKVGNLFWHRIPLGNQTARTHARTKLHESISWWDSPTTSDSWINVDDPWISSIFHGSFMDIRGYRRLGVSPTGQSFRFVSCVRASGRSGCPVEFDPKSARPSFPFSLWPRRAFPFPLRE